MLDENIKNEFKLLRDKTNEMINTVEMSLRHQNEQKSKKTEKWDGRYTCKLRLLYATKKYGCSGIEGSIECLECRFRR